MSQLNYVPGSATAAAVSGVFNKTLTQGPYAQGRKITQVVPAGVTTMYVTGCATGGSTIASGAISSVLDRDNAVFDGVSYVSLDAVAYSDSQTYRCHSVSGTLSFNSMTALTGRYVGAATGASASGTPFIVSAGYTNASTVSGIGWSTDGGYTWTTRSVTGLVGSACAKQVLVSNDGRAVVLWGNGNSGDVVLSATKDYGATWTDMTGTTLGDSTLAQGTMEFINNQFIVAVSGGGKFRYATDPTGTWASFTTGAAGNPSSIAWDGATYVFGGNAGVIYTASALTGPYTLRTSNLATSEYTYVVAGATGNFVAFVKDTSASNSVSYSTNSGATWTNAAPQTSSGYRPGGLVYSAALGLFILNSTSASWSHRSPTGAAWTSIASNNPSINGYPSTSSHTGYSRLQVVPAGVIADGKLFRSATATAWEGSLTMEMLGYTTASVNGFDLTVSGSSSGNLLTLRGGKGNSNAQATSKGSDGGGLVLAGGKGAQSAWSGGSGLYGTGGQSSTTAADSTVIGTTPMAGNGSRAFATNLATAGGGTISIISLQTGLPVGIRVPGAGGGFSTFSTNAYCGGGGGSMYSRGGDALLALNPVCIDAEGIGQGGYGSWAGTNVIGGAGGGEGCYRIPITVVPGETLTITIPGRASCSFETPQRASCGGPGFLFMEWSE